MKEIETCSPKKEPSEKNFNDKLVALENQLVKKIEHLENEFKKTIDAYIVTVEIEIKAMENKLNSTEDVQKKVQQLENVTKKQQQSYEMMGEKILQL